MKVIKNITVVNEVGESIEITQDEYKAFMTEANIPELSIKHPFLIGQKILARTVTYHVTGEIVAIDGHWLTLRNAAWIADSGRFSNALESCEFAEVEPFKKDMFLNMESVTDVTTIETLPRIQK